jgi:hypothetical protein
MDIIPERRKWKTKDTCDEYDAGFLRVLFRDKPLVEAIGRRTNWQFRNLATLLAVIELVPSFPSTVTHLDLLFHSVWSNPWSDRRHPRNGDWRQSSVNEALANLPVCRCLTVVGLQPNCVLTETDSIQNLDLNLDLIVEKLPSITSLRIIGPSRLSGSLGGLTNLKELIIDATFSKVVEGVVSLPFGSAKSLTHIAVICNVQEFFCDADCGNRAFDEFVNLNTLYVHPLSDNMCDVLLRSKIRLREFRTTVMSIYGHIHIAKVVRMLSASSLRFLKKLIIAFEHDDTWTGDSGFCPFYEQITKAITRDHYELESLVLGLGINSDWLPNFSRLAMLRELTWYVPSGYCRIETRAITFMADRISCKFDRVFDGFVRKPLVAMWVLGRYPHPNTGLMIGTKYESVTRCDRAPSLYANSGLSDAITLYPRRMETELFRYTILGAR